MKPSAMDTDFTRLEMRCSLYEHRIKRVTSAGYDGFPDEVER